MVASAIRSGLAIGVGRDGREPPLGFVRLACAQLAWRIEGTGRAALGLREDVVPGLIDARKRKAVTGGGDVVADAGEFRCLRRLACKQARDRIGAGLALRAGGGSGFRDASAET